MIVAMASAFLFTVMANNRAKSRQTQEETG
jgi:hypothetical protein